MILQRKWKLYSENKKTSQEFLVNLKKGIVSRYITYRDDPIPQWLNISEIMRDLVLDTDNIATHTVYTFPVDIQPNFKKSNKCIRSEKDLWKFKYNGFWNIGSGMPILMSSIISWVYHNSTVTLQWVNKETGDVIIVRKVPIRLNLTKYILFWASSTSIYSSRCVEDMYKSIEEFTSEGTWIHINEHGAKLSLVSQGALY